MYLAKNIAAPKVKRVIVIGGGPAGLEATRFSAQRGHKVELFDQSPRLGGQLNLAVIPPHKEILSDFRKFLIDQVSRLEVPINLGWKLSPTDLIDLKPDVIVVATGSRPFIPTIPGVREPNVYTANEVLLGEKITGQKVIIIGGELVACETAEWLANQGKSVTLVRRGAKMASNVAPAQRSLLLERLLVAGVKQVTGVKEYKEINSVGLLFEDHLGQEILLKGDTFVIASGAVADGVNWSSATSVCERVYVIGDAVKPRRILDAVEEGYWAALSI